MRTSSILLPLFLGLLLPAIAHAQPYAGSPDLEPGLQGRSDIILFEDFELTDWQDHFTSIAYPENVEVVSSPVFQGAQGLVVRVSEGNHNGGSLSFDFVDAGLQEPEEIYFRYYVYLDASWEKEPDGEIGKFPGFGGTYNVAGWGGRPSDGTNGWSARMMNWDNGTTGAVGFYTYHADMSGIYGTHMEWDGQIQREQWYCVEAYVRLNSISGSTGNNDGILRGWVDETPVFEKDDIRFRDVDSLKIEQVWGNIYVGGSWSASRDMALYFDNWVIARNPIGCYSDALPADAGAGGSAGSGGDAGGETGGSGGSVATGGSGGSAGSAGGSGGSAGDATGGGAGTNSVDGGTSGATAQPQEDDDGGCGCRLTGSSNRGVPILALLAVFGVVVRRSYRKAHSKWKGNVK